MTCGRPGSVLLATVANWAAFDIKNLLKLKYVTNR